MKHGRSGYGACHAQRCEVHHLNCICTWLDRQRLRPQQWPTSANWKVHRANKSGAWFGFDCLHQLEDIPAEIAMVPLDGHTHGHAGVAVQRDEGWLLQSGDAYFSYAEMEVERPRCTPGSRFYQWMMERARLANQERLRQLKRSHGDSVQLICGHEVREFESLAGHPLRQPADQVSSNGPAGR